MIYDEKQALEMAKEIGSVLGGSPKSAGKEIDWRMESIVLSSILSAATQAMEKLWKERLRDEFRAAFLEAQKKAKEVDL